VVKPQGPQKNRGQEKGGMNVTRKISEGDNLSKIWIEGNSCSYGGV